MGVLWPLDSCSVLPKVSFMTEVSRNRPRPSRLTHDLSRSFPETGGLFPGLNFVLTTWYNRNEQNMVISLFFAGSTLAGAFGGASGGFSHSLMFGHSSRSVGILAYGIRHMAGDGGKDGWSWMCVRFTHRLLPTEILTRHPLISIAPQLHSRRHLHFRLCCSGVLDYSRLP